MTAAAGALQRNGGMNAGLHGRDFLLRCLQLHLEAQALQHRVGRPVMRLPQRRLVVLTHRLQCQRRRVALPLDSLQLLAVLRADKLCN